MKNLTIKKIALGVFLAGYAASGAFALNAVTVNSIVGNAPSLGKKGTTVKGPGTNTITVTAGASNKVANKVGYINDEAIFEFVTTDVDGDTPETPPSATSAGSEAKLTVYYWQPALNSGAGDWVAAAASSYTYNGTGKVTFKLGTDAANATKIGYKIQAQTEYGDPDLGTWLSGDTLLAATSPQPGDGTAGGEETDPGKPGTGGSGDGDVTGGPSGTDPIPSSSAKYAIFKSGAYTVGDNYSITPALPAKALTPKLGDSFELVYWDDSGTVADEFESGTEVRYTPVNIQWIVSAGNGPANGGVAASDVALTGETSATVTLPSDNTLPGGWTALAAKTPEAGVQGFILKVSFD